MTKAEQIEELARLILIRMGWAGFRLLDAKETAEAIWDNDWRKVEKPPVLTIEMPTICALIGGSGATPVIAEILRQACEIQRDADWKAMRGEE